MNKALAVVRGISLLLTALCGLAALGYGLHQIYPPLAFVAGGIYALLTVRVLTRKPG